MSNKIRQSKKESQIAQRLMAKPVTPFKQVDPKDSIIPFPPHMTRVFMNERVCVMIFDHTPTTKGNAIKAMIQRHDKMPIPGHWKEMMKIKNEIFGEETLAIEYYPKQSKLVDEFNIYWLWIFPDGLIPELV